MSSVELAHLFTFLRATFRFATIRIDDGDTGDFVGHDDVGDVQAGGEGRSMRCISRSVNFLARNNSTWAPRRAGASHIPAISLRISPPDQFISQARDQLYLSCHRIF